MATVEELRKHLEELERAGKRNWVVTHLYPNGKVRAVEPRGGKLHYESPRPSVGGWTVDRKDVLKKPEDYAS